MTRLNLISIDPHRQKFKGNIRWFKIADRTSSLTSLRKAIWNKYYFHSLNKRVSWSVISMRHFVCNERNLPVQIFWLEKVMVMGNGMLWLLIYKHAQGKYNSQEISVAVDVTRYWSEQRKYISCRLLYDKHMKNL